jgi:thiazole synthase
MTVSDRREVRTDTPLTIAGREFTSRLIMGTGKWRSSEEMNGALAAGGAQMITVALRRIDFDDPASRSVLEDVDWEQYQILPNTAGCATAEEAVRIARLARSMGLSDWVKLEVIPDPKYLFPDPAGTLEAAEILVADGFTVLPYIMDDPVLAMRLEAVGCATVMPLAAPIGSGQGLTHFDRIQMIVEQASVPVIVDAGIGAPSDAALAMELGADACLINTAIAQAGDPVRMARAMRAGIEAGRDAYLAGRIEKRAQASPSSPTTGISR